MTIFRKLKDRRVQARKQKEIEQYMTDAFLLDKDSFWKEVEDAQYFSLSPKERKAFAYAAAQRHNLEPNVIFRRIWELKILHS